MKHLHVLLFISVLSLSSFSQVRKYSNEFLSIGVGARALGMSNSQVALVNDVTAGYWNPAGLLGVQNNMQLSLMHAEYFAGIAKYDYGALAFKIDSSSTMAISLIRFGVDDIPNTTELIDANGNIDHDRISTFSAADYAMLFSYAKILPALKGLRLGGNAKIIRRKVGDFAGAWGFGLDAGAQYDFKSWKLGLLARDITGTFNAWSFDLSEEMRDVFIQTGNEIPVNSLEITLPRLILGGARRFEFMQSKISLEPELDLDVTFDGKRNVLISSFASIEPHLGFEAGYKNILFLRGGIGNIQRYTDENQKRVTTFQPNFGVGLRLKVFTIDYALTDIGDQSVALYSNIFSLKFDINRKPE